MDLEEQYTKLLQYCYARVKDWDLAEDLTQESFLRFWQAKSYQSMGKEMAYLYTIARNLCLDEHKRKKDELAEDDGIFASVADENANVESAVADRILVERAMAHLSPADREIVELRYVSEVSVTDIGKILGLSRFAVHRRLRAAKEILKQEMEGCV